MGLESSKEKLNKYLERLSKGKVEKIKPSHVEKVIRKLQAKEKILLIEIAETKKASKKERLEHKLETAREQVKRAEWLLQQIGKG